MRKIAFDKKVVKDYYEGKFTKDLQRYFDIQVQDGIPRILSRNVRFNNGEPASQNPSFLSLDAWKNAVDRDAGIDVTQQNFIFSGLYYFMLLIPQTIRKRVDEEAEYDFYRCTGWPLSSADRGGCLPPEQMLSEASLFPDKVEYDNYCAMLDVVAPFMFEEIRQFLSRENSNNLNAEAYNRLLKAMQWKNEMFMDSISIDVSFLYRYLSGGNMPKWA